MDKVTSAEIAIFIAKHNLPMAVGDEFGLLAKKMWCTRRLQHQLVFLYKIKYNLLNISLPQNLVVPCTRTRNSDPNKFVQIPTRINTYAYSFYPRVTRAWNLLPNEILRLSYYRHFPSGREHCPTCSTSPSKSVLNTNRCKYVILFHVSFGPLFKSFIVSHVLHPKHAHDAKLLC